MLRSEKAAMVNNWNRKYVPGQKVKVILDDKTEKITHTRSNAELLGGHTPAIWLEGFTGCYALDRVTPIH
jgi:hypothetical protein